MRTLPLLVMIALMGALLSCGQKGPLVLPDAQHPHKKIGQPKPPSSAAPSVNTGTVNPTPVNPSPTPAPVPTDATTTGEVKGPAPLR